jgi:hypothetical protein
MTRAGLSGHAQRSGAEPHRDGVERPRLLDSPELPRSLGEATQQALVAAVELLHAFGHQLVGDRVERGAEHALRLLDDVFGSGSAVGQRGGDTTVVDGSK